MYMTLKAQNLYNPTSAPHEALCENLENIPAILLIKYPRVSADYLASRTLTLRANKIEASIHLTYCIDDLLTLTEFSCSFTYTKNLLERAWFRKTHSSRKQRRYGLISLTWEKFISD
jgi:hypothetical protein